MRSANAFSPKLYFENFTIKIAHFTGRSFRSTVSAFLCFLLLTAFFLPKSAHAEEQIVRVGWYDGTDHLMSRDGTRCGYAYDYQQEIANYTGWTYEYVEGTWGELYEMLVRGEIDLLSGVTYRESRLPYILYSDAPIGTYGFYLIYPTRNQSDSSNPLMVLDGKRLGYPDGGFEVSLWESYLTRMGIQTELVPLTNTDAEVAQMMESGELGAYLTGNLSKEFLEPGLTVLQLSEDDSYFGFAKDRADLKGQLDSAMLNLRRLHPFLKDELRSKYFTTIRYSMLTKEQTEWLDTHGPIRIGYLEGSLANTDTATGAVNGVLAEYLQFASGCLDNRSLVFETIPMATEHEMGKALAEGTVDVLFPIVRSLSNGEQNGGMFTTELLSLPMAAVTAKKDFVETDEQTVAVRKDDLTTQWYLKERYPDWKISVFDDAAACEKAVSDRTADCMIANAYEVQSFAKSKSLYCIYLTQAESISFLLRRGDSTLLSVLNQTIAMMPGSVMQGALTKYAVPEHHTTFVEFLQENALQAIAIVLVVSGLFLFVVLGSLFQSRKDARKLAKLNDELQANHRNLETALRAAEQANRAKTAFLSNMSHDLRTPLNAILGYSNLMTKDLKDPKLLSYKEKIEASGNLLLSLIDNVLDMARIDSGNVELSESVCSVSKIASEIANVLGEEARRKSIELRSVHQFTHDRVLCDSTKVREIFVNITGNAVKYTSAGGTVTTEIRELPCDEPGYVTLQTTISDTGIGMSKDFLPHLFDSFSRERNTTAGKIAGTGLGMAIVKRYVDALGGTIEVESEQGVGSVFTITLTHRLADDSETVAMSEAGNDKAKESLRSKHFLLAEDNELNAEIAMAVFEDAGLSMDWVKDGAECCARIEEKPAGTYDLILMDIQMPNMNGYEAAHRIRSMAEPAKANIPIVAVTANAFDKDVENALDAGMNGHISKPIDISRLFVVLNDILRKDG